MNKYFKNICICILFLLLSFAALVSVWKGLENASSYSQDFQWSPAVLFWEGVNPYTYYISGNADNRIILSQAPNYAHITYILLSPFASLDWSSAKIYWAIFNIVLAFSCVGVLCRYVGFNLINSLFVLLVFLCSTPFRNTIGNGQHSIIVLILFCGLLLQNKNIGSFLAGGSYFKYSFMPPLAAYILFGRGLKAFIFSGLICAFGWVVFSFLLSEDLFSTLMQPLKVSAISVGSGTADFMTIASIIGFENKILNFIFYYLIPILLSLAIGFYASGKNNDPLFVLSFVAAGSLVTFKHLGYDFTLLLPAFVYFFRYREFIWAKIGLALIFFNWFGLKMVAPLNLGLVILTSLNFVLCLVLMIALIKLFNNKSLAK